MMLMNSVKLIREEDITGEPLLHEPTAPVTVDVATPLYTVQNETKLFTLETWQHCSCVCSSLAKEKLAVSANNRPGNDWKINS